MERVLATLGLAASTATIDDRLEELGFGDWEGRTWRELKAEVRPLVKARQSDKWAFVPPGGESYAGLLSRLRPWLATVRTGDVVVAHGGVARALLRECAGVAASEAPDVEITQGRVLWFRRGRAEWF